MTSFLASVRDCLEAEIALGAGADIIDLKEPGGGALGAVEPGIVVQAVGKIAGRAETSATLGDLPMRPQIVAEAVARSSHLGVDYIKLGLFPDGDPQGCLTALRGRTGAPRLIIVLFADRQLTFDAVVAAAEIGADGVMLDTAGKASGSLLDHARIDTLADFVAAARAKALLVGLAGSLKALHVPELLALAPDLLGFRGALCRASDRAGAIDAASCRAIRGLIPELQPRPAARKSALHDPPARAL